MTPKDRVGGPPGRRKAAGDAAHRQGVPTPSGGPPTRPEGRLCKAFGVTIHDLWYYHRYPAKFGIWRFLAAMWIDDRFRDRRCALPADPLYPIASRIASPTIDGVSRTTTPAASKALRFEA